MQTKGTRLYIFLEYVSGGSVQSVLERFGPLSELVIRRYGYAQRCVRRVCSPSVGARSGDGMTRRASPRGRDRRQHVFA